MSPAPVIKSPRWANQFAWHATTSNWLPNDHKTLKQKCHITQIYQTQTLKFALRGCW